MVAGRRCTSGANVKFTCQVHIAKPGDWPYGRAVLDSQYLTPTSDLPSVRRLLLTLAAGCVIPIVLLALGSIAYLYHRERLAVEATTIATARALMGAVDDRMHDIQLALAGLAMSPQLAEGNLAQFEQQALVVQRSEEVTNVVLLDATGRQLMNTRPPAGAALPVQSRAEMLEPIRRGRPTVLDLVPSALTGVPTVGIGIPIWVRDQWAYSLTANFDPAVLQQVLLRQKLPPTWIAAVLDSRGKIVARTRDHARYLGTPARAALLQRISQVAEDAIESFTVDNVPVVTAFSRSPVSNWTVSIGIPRDEVGAAARNSLALLLAGAASVLGVTLWLAWSMANRISKSVEALGAAVRRAGHVPTIELPQPRFQEAHQLGQAFLSATAELQDAYAALGRNAERLRTILDTAMDAVVTVDEGGRIVLFNRAAEEMFGIAGGQALGSPLDRFIPAEARPTHRQKMTSFGQVGGPSRMMGAGRVISAQRADGTAFPAEVSIAVGVEKGRRLYTAILRDVSEREQHKEALVRSNLELQQFAFVASHDLRSPLKSITGYLDLLSTRHGEAMGEIGLALIGRARTAAVHMDKLTQDLLAYARLESRAALAPVDCQAVVAEALQLLHEEIAQTGGEVIAQDVPTLNGDSGQLLQLFINLIGNALKYRRGTPRVEVTAQRQARGWLFAVRDNGIGIDPQYLDRIFDIFKRLHTRREYPGTGIGLALCRRVVHSHGGTIWATSQPGQGSTFLFTIADSAGELHE